MKIFRGRILLAALALAWSLPAESVSLKQVLTGNVTMSTAAKTVTLSPSVDTTKAFVICQNRQANSNNDTRVTCELTTSTTLTITKGANTADAGETVQYYVVEFSSGVTVQRGLANINLTKSSPAACPGALSGGNCVLSPAVDMTKSFVIISERIDANEPINNNTDEQWTVRGQFSNNCLSAHPNPSWPNCTLLEIQRNKVESSGSTSSPAIWVAWQVVTITDSAVYQDGSSPSDLPVSGNNSISGSSLSKTTSPAFSPALNINQTFVVFSWKGLTAGTGKEAQYMVRCALCTGATCSGTTTGISCTRTGPATDAETISSYAVQLTDCSSVQSGNATLNAGTATANVALSPAVDLTKSIAIISVSGGSGTDVADLGDASVTAAFTSTTNLQLQRVSSVTAAVVSWFVVQFGGSSGTVVDQVESIQ